MPLFEVRLYSTAGDTCQTCQKPIRQGVQFGINGSKWRHLPHCIGDKVKKEVRGYEFDKKVSQRDLKGFSNLPKADQDRVVKTFEFDKPFDQLSFRKKPEIDWHGDQLAEGSCAESSTASWRPEEDSASQWRHDEEVQCSGELGWTEASSHHGQPGRRSAESGAKRSSHDPWTSSLSRRGGRTHSNPPSSHSAGDDRNWDHDQSPMPGSPNKFKGRNWREKPSRKPVNKLELSPPKVQVQPPRGGVGSSWGDAAPSWGDAEPSWGYGDTPSGNQATSDSVWDNPTLEPNPEPAAAAETSEWGGEEWSYPGASDEREGNSGDGRWSYDNHATDSHNNINSENNGWGNGDWVYGEAETADPTATAGWDGSYNTNEYSEQYNRQQNNEGFDNGGNWGVLSEAEVPTSWGGEASESHCSTGDAGNAFPAISSSGFQLNPAALVFVPKNFIPPTTAVQAESEPAQPSSTTVESAEPSTRTTPNTATNSFPLQSTQSAEPSTRTTPNTATNSLPLQSTLNSGTFSTPATCLIDASAEATDVTEQLRRVDLEVAEYKLEVSQADLDMKKASLEVMKAKLEVMEKKRAMLAAKQKMPAK